MRKQTKPTPEPSDSDLRGIERQESELRAIEQDDDAEPATPLTSSTVDLAHLGIDRLAYVRRAMVGDLPVWSIYSATGLQIGEAPSLERAWGAIVQNDLQPVFVH